MEYESIAFHNVHEFLRGSGSEVLTEETLATLRVLNPDAARLSEQDERGLWFTRIPNELRLKLNTAAQLNALQSAGCEMRFNLVSPSARIVLKSTLSPSVVEVYQGSFLVGWQVVGCEPTEITVTHPANLAELEQLSRQRGLPYDAHLTRLLLPWRPACRLLGVEGDFTPPQEAQVPARRFLSYGSSITHGNASVAPSASYVGRLSQKLGMDALNLGLGGGAHLESEIADYLAARSDWDCATLEMGINIVGSVACDEFERRVRYLLEAVAGRNRDKPVFAIDLYTCRYDLQGDDKIVAFRAIVGGVVRTLNLPHVIHVPGNALLTALHGLTADLVHPSPYGMEEIAAGLARIIRAHI